MSNVALRDVSLCDMCPKVRQKEKKWKQFMEY